MPCTTRAPDRRCQAAAAMSAAEGWASGQLGDGCKVVSSRRTTRPVRTCRALWKMHDRRKRKIINTAKAQKGGRMAGKQDGRAPGTHRVQLWRTSSSHPCANHAAASPPAAAPLPTLVQLSIRVASTGTSTRKPLSAVKSRVQTEAGATALTVQLMTRLAVLAWPSSLAHQGARHFSPMKEWHQKLALARPTALLPCLPMCPAPALSTSHSLSPVMSSASPNLPTRTRPHTSLRRIAHIPSQPSLFGMRAQKPSIAAEDDLLCGVR